MTRIEISKDTEESGGKGRSSSLSIYGSSIDEEPVGLDTEPGTTTPLGSLKAVLAEKWKEALLSCREDLARVSKADSKKILGFDTEKALMEDLKKRKEDNNPTWIAQATNQVLPAVATLSTTTGLFLGAMKPRSMETALIWGAFHLMIQLSLNSKQKWDDFVERHLKITRSLEILNICAARFENGEGSHTMSEAIYEVFVNLISFWIEAVRKFVDSVTEKLANNGLHQKFQTAMSNVEGAVQHLRDVADLELHRERIVGRQQRQAGLSHNTLKADNTSQFPKLFVPWPASDFEGRQNELKELDVYLDPKRSRGRLQSVLLHGLGGVGKSETALHYAHTNPSGFDAIFWIRSETPESLKASFTEIATRLKLPGADLKGQDEQNLLCFQNWLEEQTNQRSWLLIFDNCESIEDVRLKYIPLVAGSILITSRHLSAKLSATRSIHLKPLSEPEGLRLFKSLMKRNMEDSLVPKEEKAIQALVEKVDGLPLGVRILAAQVESHGTPPAEFLTYYNQHARKLLKKARRVEYYDRDKTRVVGEVHILDNVWIMSFERLTPEATSLIGILSLLSPDEIPQGLFCNETTEEKLLLPKILICEDEFELNEAIKDLREAALIEKNNSMLSLHRLVQEAFIHSRKLEQLQEHFEAAFLLLYRSFPGQINGRPMHNDWKQCRSLIQHCQHSAKVFKECIDLELIARPPQYLGELLKSCAWYLFELSDYKAALTLIEIANTACVNKETEIYAHLLNTAASCSFELNDLKRCREASEQGLRLRTKFLEEKIPNAEVELANNLNNFGNLESAAGNLDEALTWFGRAEEIRTRIGEEEIVALGVTHLTTGRAYFLKKEYSQALSRYKMAEDIFAKKLGPNNYFAAHLAYARGNLELDQNNIAAARSYYDRALEILEEASPFHVFLCACYYKKACLDWIERRDDKALELLEKALAIAELQEARGDEVRIVRKQEQILEQRAKESIGVDTKRPTKSANFMRLSLLGPMQNFMDDSDAAWDSLSCGYFR
ncbi:MAG: hypothetical protein MMC33_009552 [Icmadophila ericetorum]|nr:hypothetical protein [Icmadophila ericetorum]